MRDKWRKSVQIGSSRQVPVTAIFPAIGCFLWQAALAPIRSAVCIVSITRLMPGVHQPDPPGLIHDDLRLLPPWRGSSLFGGFFRARDRFFVPPWLRNVIFNKTYQRVCLVVPRRAFIHRCHCRDGGVSVGGRRLTS